MKTTVHTIRSLKAEPLPIVAVTAYDAILAQLASEAGVDMILVGDSVGTTYLGFNTTIPVTLDMIVHHTACVARVQPRSLIVADVPFATAHSERLLEACTRLLQKGGAEAVKLEGGRAIAEKVHLLSMAGIPVLGHIGLLPQNIHTLGKYRRFGISPEECKKLNNDATALEKAGAFAIIGEMIEPECAKNISRSLKIPLIGIGSGAQCDGQIVVTPDLLGLTLKKMPRFVKPLVNLKETIREALTTYTKGVQQRTYPQ